MLSTEIYIYITLIILLLCILIEDDIMKIKIKLNLKATLIHYFDKVFYTNDKMFDTKFGNSLIQRIIFVENFFQSPNKLFSE